MVRYLDLLIRSKDNLWQIETPTEVFTQFKDEQGVPIFFALRKFFSQAFKESFI